MIRTEFPNVAKSGAVQLRVTKTTPSFNILELRVEYDKAEAPSRAYYADYCNVIAGRGSISLIFGKLKPGTDVLRNKVEISFPEDLFIRQIWRGTSHLHDRACEEAKARPIAAIQNLVDTDVSQSFRSNNVFIMGMGEEGLLDFYYIAPSEVHFALVNKKPEIILDPVIRIIVGGALLSEFFEHCEIVARALPGFTTIMNEAVSQ